MKNIITAGIANLRRLNLPIPGWLTIALILGGTALAAVPVFNGSIRVPTGGTLVTASGVAPSFGAVPTWTGALPQSQGGTADTIGSPTFNTLKLQPAAANASLQLTSANGFSATANLDTFSGSSYISLNNDASAIGSLVNVGSIFAKTPSGNCGGATIAHMDFITAGTAATPGGGIIFHTSDDSGLCADAEPLVLTPDHHAYMPYDQFYYQVNTPTTCTALVPCGTIVWTFTKSFHNTAGALNQPHCTSGMIRDDNSTTRSWVLNVQALSATAVTYNYAPLTSIASATTLEVWAECHPSGY